MRTFELQCRHSSDSAIINPLIFEQFFEYKGFVNQGYKFSTDLRAAKKVSGDEKKVKIRIQPNKTVIGSKLAPMSSNAPRSRQ